MFFRREDSNKRKSEIQQKESDSSGSEQIKNIILASLDADEPTSESETLKESTVESVELRRRKKDNVNPKTKKKTRALMNTDDDPDCYYCKHLCNYHRMEVLTGQHPTGQHHRTEASTADTVDRVRSTNRMERKGKQQSTADISIQTGKEINNGETLKRN